MTFNDLKDNENLFMYFTITDTALFVKKPEYADKIDKLMEKRSYEANKDEFAAAVKQGKLDRRGQEEFIRERKNKFYKDHLMEVLEEKEEWVDAEKYLLSCAFRIKNLLVLLEDPANRDRFSQFDNFLPYRRIYAETLKEINRLLDGKDVKISCKAKHGMNPSGYWDDVKQAFVDASYSTDELRVDYLTGPIQRALSLENNATVDELKAFSEEPIRVFTDNPEVAPDDIREFALKMAQNNPNIQFMDVGQKTANKVKAQRKMNKEEEQKYIIKNALEQNGLTRIGKSKVVASYDGKDVDLDKGYVEALKESMIHTLEDYRDQVKGLISYEDAVDVLYKLDSIILVGIEEDERVRKLLKEIAEFIKEKCDADDKFCSDYVDGLNEDVRYVREKINYDVSKRLIEISENANIIRLDIATSIFESIRSIKRGDIEMEYIAYFPVYLDYSKAISSLYNAFSLKEISYIYQLYSRIDKLNYDIKNHNTKDIKKDIILILNKIYGDNYMKILMVDPDKVSFRELYQNNYIISEYKEILLKLDEICER